MPRAANSKASFLETGEFAIVFRTPYDSMFEIVSKTLDRMVDPAFTRRGVSKTRELFEKTLG